MRIENSFYMLTAASGQSAWSDDGIWDGDEFVDMSKKEWQARDLVNPFTVVKSGPLLDYLYAAPYRCLSDQAYNLMVGILNFWPEVKWTKLRVLNRQKRYLAYYWWLRCNLFGGLAALDMEHAKYTIYPPDEVVVPGSIVVDEVTEWVLDGRVIGNLDWFRSDQQKWFVSLKAKKLIEELRLSGFSFFPVPVYIHG